MDFQETLTYAAQTLLLLAAVALGVIGLTAICATKKVDGYYLTTVNGAPGICVASHWTWHPDQVVYCTDRAQDALDFVTKANQSVK